MSEIIPSLISCSLYILVPAAIAASLIYGIHRMQKAARAEIRDDSCVACDGTDLTPLGPGAYRCNACGYEGGSGLQKMKDDQRRAQIDALSPQARRDSARRDLIEARDYLKAAQSTFVSARSSATHDLIGLGGGDRGQTKQAELLRALSDVQRAQRFLLDADLKLSTQEADPNAVNDELSPFLSAADIHLDGIGADLAMLNRIQEASDATDKLLAQVEDRLRAFGAPIA